MHRLFRQLGFCLSIKSKQWGRFRTFNGTARGRSTVLPHSLRIYTWVPDGRSIAAAYFLVYGRTHKIQSWKERAPDKVRPTKNGKSFGHTHTTRDYFKPMISAPASAVKCLVS